MESLLDSDPQQIGPYRLLYRLGAGGMGRVYLGMSRGNRAVAIKVIHPFLAVDPIFAASFRREVEAAKAVSGAYTAPVIAYGLDDPQPWLATAYVEGPSLAAAIIERQAALPETAVWRLAGGLVEALQAVHACNLVHRDLKPANVLLDLNGPKVIDFGISRALEEIFTTIGRHEPIGTPAYMSPEQAECKPVGPASDVFSLGSVLAYAATGRVLFGGGSQLLEMYRVVNDQPDLTDIAEPLRSLVDNCLAKSPAGRPSLDELLDAIMAGGSAFSVTSPSSFWPRSLATYIRTRNDVTSPHRPLNEPREAPPASEAGASSRQEADPSNDGDHAAAPEPHQLALVPLPQLADAPNGQAEAPSADDHEPEQDLPVMALPSEAAAANGPRPPGIAEQPDLTAGPDADTGTEPAVTAAATASGAAEKQSAGGPDQAASETATMPPSTGELAIAVLVATGLADDLSADRAVPLNEERSPRVDSDAGAGVPGGRSRGALPRPGGIATDGHGQSAATNGARQEIPRQPRRRLFAAGAGVVTAAVLAALAYLVWPGQAAAGHQTSASYAASPVHYSDGLEIRASWTLGGADGKSLTEKITASDTKGVSLSVQYREPLPQAALTGLGAAEFTPSAPMIVNQGRGLVWPLRIKAGGHAVVTYRVGIAGLGVSQARLRQLLRKFTLVAQGPVTLRPPPVTLQSLTIIPEHLRLRAGHSGHLSLVGRLSNGKAAPASYLAKVRWTTTDHHVAVVNNFGKVTAIAQGSVKIIAMVGALHTSIYVRVSDRANNSSPGSGTTPTYTPPSGRASSPPPRTKSTAPPTTPITTTPTQI
jgi:serine/threonine protein kinase